jgi:hypothetical protein
MALGVIAVAGAGATGPALPAPLPPNSAPQIANAVGQVNAGNMFGAPGTFIPNVFNWRVDRQNAPGGQVNVSVQRNNVGAPSTIASVFVPTALNLAPGPNAAVNLARTRELERTVRRGLELSLASHAAGAAPGAFVITRFIVNGAYSA